MYDKSFQFCCLFSYSLEILSWVIMIHEISGKNRKFLNIFEEKSTFSKVIFSLLHFFQESKINIVSAKERIKRFIGFYKNRFLLYLIE